ncbi:MAG: excinuclease ABC subunit UvrA [Planctomycetota bacterium]
MNQEVANCIRIHGARTHNLQNLDLALPRDRLVVVTGPSGSGKSSLAFDTLHAEGQRQYIESLSPYARQFLHQLERPDVDLIEGMQPTISIDQRAGSPNRRSTVATVTEIYDYLRLLYARLGESTCYQCGTLIRQQSLEQILETLLSRPTGTRMMILAPIIRGHKGQHREAIEGIRKAGFLRARINGEMLEVNEPPELSPQKVHHIEAVVDRIVIREGVEPRLAESIRLAVRHGDGLVLASEAVHGGTAEPQWRDELFSTLYSCPNCKISYEEIEPRTFSFNSPYGACPACEGLAQVACPECHGARLRPEARAVRLAGKAIHEATAANVTAAYAFFQGLTFPADRRPIAEPITSEILSRLDFLGKVGLGYLTLDRPAETLSGGELQRVRLASGLGSGLVGVCYVLDEPSIGLHPRDNERLIETLEGLQARGNTVVVVEHDEAIMRRADWLIDLGPGAGRNGGRIVAEGTPAEVAANPASLTGRYLAGTEKIPVPDNRRPVAMARAITLEGVTTNNLKNITAKFPLSVLICVTGVSGSGKSSLLNETLAQALVRQLGGIAPNPGPFVSLHGASQIDKVVQIDQLPIGRTPRSNPATYTGIFDEIRKVFAGTRDARALGYKSSRFSFNIKGGRCGECRGQGQRRIKMNFLPDLYVPCPVCEGKRFDRQTLQICYRGLSIADVLELRVDEAVEFFQNHTAIARLLASLQEVGLGYVTLGQSSTTLSGGEAQRIKLANELGCVDTGKTFYILDEPTTGLHFDDIKKLLAVLSRLVDLGNTVVVIEHNVDVMKTADWIIDLGPDGGDNGGYVVATGTPEQVAAMEENCTGQFLRGSLPTPAGSFGR